MSDDATYLDTAGSEYDPLRPTGKDERVSEETREIEVNGKVIKTTFIGFGNDGQVKRVRGNELSNINSIVNNEEAKFVAQQRQEQQQQYQNNSSRSIDSRSSPVSSSISSAY